jgi:DNA-binding GntR family transcriptional regulator
VPEPLLRAVSVSEALTDALRERILSGEIAPGTPLPEAEIAARYGVARPTVRTALQGLVSLGLLRREVNRSAYVPKLDAADIRDLFFVRKWLECDTVRLLAQRRLRPVAAERAVRRLEAFRDNADWSAVADADLAFHRALIAAVGSRRLARVYALLQDEIRLSLAHLQPAYESPSALAAEHRELLEAIAGGDADGAARLLEAHLDQAVEALTAQADAR